MLSLYFIHVVWCSESVGKGRDNVGVPRCVSVSTTHAGWSLVCLCRISNLRLPRRLFQGLVAVSCRGLCLCETQAMSASGELASIPRSSVSNIESTVASAAVPRSSCRVVARVCVYVKHTHKL